MMQVVPPPGTSPPGPELRDIHLPPEPSWWPPAPGWWVLGCLLLAVLLAGAWWWRRRRHVRQRNQSVMRELDNLLLQYQHGGDGSVLAAGLQQLLRRVARQHEPRATQLRGEEWRQVLARLPVDALTLQRLQELDQRIYQPDAAFDDAAAATAVRAWLQLALKPSAWKPAATERADA